MNAQRLLDTFFDLVRIDSPSLHEGELAAYCKRILEETGCEVDIDDTAAVTGSDTGNVIARLPGTAAGQVLFTAHMDNVEPCRGIEPLLHDGIIETDGTTVLGGDDLAGVAAIIEAVRSLFEGSEPYPSVTAVFTVGEEIGLLGARAIDDGLFRDNPLVLVCDGDLAPGTVTIGSAYQYKFDMVFHGSAAHAGVSPEKGVSAVQMAASAVAAMHLGRLDETTTANVAQIEGAAPSNVIPDTCSLMGECRAMSMERLDEVRASIEECAASAAKRFGGSYESTWEVTVKGYSLDENDPLVRLVLDAARSIGLEPVCDVSCGATDGNHYMSKGGRPLVLGTGMSDFHSTREHIAVAHLEGICKHLEAIAHLMGTKAR